MTETGAVKPTKIRLRSGPASLWLERNPVLLAGEAGHDTTANKIKIGDGTKKWSELSFVVGSEGPPGAPGSDATVNATNVAAAGAFMKASNSYDDIIDGASFVGFSTADKAKLDSLSPGGGGGGGNSYFPSGW